MTGACQRATAALCVADLVRLESGLAKAKWSADYVQKFPASWNVKDAIPLTMVDSGHANGQPAVDEIERFKSVGGFFLCLADRCV